MTKEVKEQGERKTKEDVYEEVNCFVEVPPLMAVEERPRIYVYHHTSDAS